jgi:6-pyruvoyltetrahydropterin/6-carboxytetrahydropterin synthase
MYELTFQFKDMTEIGYAIDFKEIKRVGCQWIDDALDHGMILNPHDKVLIDATRAVNGKLWVMSLKGGDYCNPSVENIAREVLLAQAVLFKSYSPTLVPRSLKLYETSNCYTECHMNSIPLKEKESFLEVRGEHLEQYAADKGVVEYDDRLVEQKDTVEVQPADKELAHSPKTPQPDQTEDPGKHHSGNSSVTTNMHGQPKHGDQMRPVQKDKEFMKRKPSSVTDNDDQKKTWDFGTKWF